MSLLMTVLITLRVPDHSNWLQPTLLNNLKIALWCFSSTVGAYLLLVHHLWITKLFKNTRTLKFKTQPTFGYFAPVNHLNKPLRKQKLYLNGFKRSWFVICDWWIPIRLVCFCISRFVACDRNHGWRQRKTQSWKRLLNVRVRVFMKSAERLYMKAVQAPQKPLPLSLPATHFKFYTKLYTKT